MARRNSGGPGVKTNVMRAKGQSYGNRSVPERDEYERFLIVCEGEKTEPNYFLILRACENLEFLGHQGA